MAVVDHQEIALRIEPRPPQFTYAAHARSDVRKRRFSGARQAAMVVLGPSAIRQLAVESVIK